MQDCPPDILISNVSMLSIMLMRNRHPDISQDRADSMIFDQTRSWLKEDEENHVFHLVIDELHLYRGASGTEVAYLLRQLLDRLGLEPTSKQLRIFASSASLDGDSEATYEFLGGMFGLTSCEARKRFHVEAGELLYSVDNLTTSSSESFDSIVEQCLLIGRDIAESNHKSSEVLNTVSKAALILGDDKKLRFFASSFVDTKQERFVARSLPNLAKRWFPRLDSSDQILAARGLCVVLGALRGVTGNEAIALPRIRFHWMVRNINGLWSTIGTGDSDDDKRTVGNLLAEPRLSLASERVLEVLYCECCGAQMLTGFRIPIDNRKNHELANFPAILENMPDEAPETRTDSQTYKTLGVIYLLPEGQMTDATLEWSHGLSLIHI